MTTRVREAGLPSIRGRARTLRIDGTIGPWSRSSPATQDAAFARITEAFRLEYGRVVASVLRIVRDIDTAEELVQEAFAQALTSWPAVGVPIGRAPGSSRRRGVEPSITSAGGGG